MTNATNILLRHNLVAIPNGADGSSTLTEDVATILMNVAYYGYALSEGAYRALVKLSRDEMVSWWKDVETNLKSITGDDRKIDSFVVYKNFPAEVLEKSESEYWIPQILMYWGFPSLYFTQEVKPREAMNEKGKALVLKRANNDSLNDILFSHLSAPARWKQQEFAEVSYLASLLPVRIDRVAFKENLVSLASEFMESGRSLCITTATDVLRLAAGLSNADVSLREDPKFVSFKKPIRRYLLSLLEKCSHLTEDVARRPEMWKRLLHQLHAGDYKNSFPNVCKVMDDLYHDRLVTFNGRVEALLQDRNEEVLQLLSTRPGDFRRRLIHVLDLFGEKAVDAFLSEEVIDKLNISQVVALRSLLASVNTRQHRVFPPNGNWNKLQIGEPRKVDPSCVERISEALGNVLRRNMPKVKFLDPATSMIKLPNNGEVSPFARGTSFSIPDEVEFIRTASYWKTDPVKGVTWFDNGWNFFGENWNNMGACCWNAINFNNGAAIFSGDPVNSSEMKGRAAQLIDLYLSKLIELGVRFAVWNILCFSNVAFAEAKDVFAALQWGKDAQKGKLFEPSRCQLSFPLTGKQLTKYVCLIDLKERKMIYLDANLHGNVQSAMNNGSALEKNMPPFVEYIDSLPSVHDLFCESVDETGKAYVLYSDRDIELQGVPAYVFQPENKTNNFTPVSVNALLT